MRWWRRKQSDLLFQVENVHSPKCGKPPAIPSLGHGRYYHAYFQSTYDDQWLFQYDRTKKKALLYGGDIGWENPVEILPGGAVDLTLSTEERLWLAACWAVATDEGPHPILVQGMGQSLLLRAMLASQWLGKIPVPQSSQNSPPSAPSSPSDATGTR
jgi:hypothetical protein